MNHLRRFAETHSVVTTLIIAIAIGSSQEKQMPPRGDGLPTGAVLRLGSTRLRLGSAFNPKIGFDARGNIGFSFADLAADHAGIALASQLLDKKEAAGNRLRHLAEKFRGDDYLPTLDDLEDALPWKTFVEKYESVSDPRFVKHLESIRVRISRTAGLEAMKAVSSEK